MARNFLTTYTLADGTEHTVHVNRRGCKGAWTAEDDIAMKALVEAALKMDREGTLRALPKEPPR